MIKLNYELLKNIIEEIKNNPKVTELELANKYFYSERTIRRYIKILKENGFLEMLNSGVNKTWKIINIRILIDEII